MRTRCSRSQTGYAPLPPCIMVTGLYITFEFASLSINHKIVFLTPPLVPILRSNNDPEVLWIVARRGAHGDQVRGGGGQGSFCGCEELFHNTGLETGAHKHTGIWCLEGGYEDEETEEWDIKKGFQFVSQFVLFEQNERGTY